MLADAVNTPEAEAHHGDWHFCWSTNEIHYFLGGAFWSFACEGGITDYVGGQVGSIPVRVRDSIPMVEQ
jgi:hypothetical protein